MADDSTSETATVELDEEGRRLQLEAEKAKYRESIAKAVQGTAEARGSLIQGLVPAVEGTPTGTVTLGEKAGAFGGWLAHGTIAAAAETISKQVIERLKTIEHLKTGDSKNVRVLVVDDRALLTGAATTRLVRDRLNRMAARLDPLAAQLDRADADLGTAVQMYEQAVEKLADRVEDKSEGRGESVQPEGGAPSVQEKPAVSATGVAGAAFGSAIDLFSLLRTDYTLTAAEVTTSPSELATLTAAHLAADKTVPGLAVQLDGFTAAYDSKILNAANSVTATRDTVRSKLATLQTRLAPVEAELTTLRARIDSLENAWAIWAAADEPNADGGQTLRARIDELLNMVGPRAKAAAPARAVADQVRSILDEVDSGLGALMQTPTGADPPLLTAVRWESLNPDSSSSDTPAIDQQAHPQAQGVVAARSKSDTGGNNRVHHVLFVGIDQVAADTVTRRSLLGTSGRITFLGAATVSWLLMDPKHDAVRAGGSLQAAKRLRLDLESGNSDLSALAHGGTLDKDPLRRLEAAASLGVLTIAVLLCVLAVIIAIGLALG